MVILGGYVRLNKAGLSMVKWDLTRIYSPKTDEEWDKEFKEYKQHPQYKNDFSNMTIEGFKIIYLLEHYHRQLGKVLGLYILVPGTIFTVLNIYRKKLKISFFLLSGLIIFQGLIGIWMVRSGLNENLGNKYQRKNVKVSANRLATHFTFGTLTYCLLLKLGLFLISKPMILKCDFAFLQTNSIIRRNLILSIHMVFFTAIFGSLMAGLDAGKIANTFPKMGDIWYPTQKHYDKKLNIVKNNLENEFLVHFNHRLLATGTLTILLCKILNLIF